MNKIKAIFLCLIIFAGCEKQNNKPVTTVKVEGTYSAIIPCADCEGINYQITLNSDSTYNEKMVYIGKDVKPVESSGNWKMKDTVRIVLTTKEGGNEQLDFSGGNLIMLDGDGNKIEGPLADKFILKPGKMKTPDTKSNSTSGSSTATLNGNWILSELNNKKLDSADYPRGKPFIDIREADNKFSGSTGCNRINGASTINGNYITFSKYNTTKMACPGDSESNFINALQTIDSYKIEGTRLMLISSGKTVLLFTR